MAPPPKNKAEVNARDKFTVYRQGWRDGAYGDDPADIFMRHPKSRLRLAYKLGWGDGKAAHDEAIRRAAATYGVDLKKAVLR